MSVLRCQGRWLGADAFAFSSLCEVKILVAEAVLSVLVLSSSRASYCLELAGHVFHFCELPQVLLSLLLSLITEDEFVELFFFLEHLSLKFVR